MLGMVGLIEDAERTMTQWFKSEGDDIILLGHTREDLGGSEYLKVVQAREQGSPPYLNLDTEKGLQDCVLSLIRGGLLQSAHDCSDGGIAVALAESCISGSEWTRGAVVTLPKGRLRNDAVLFGESVPCGNFRETEPAPGGARPCEIVRRAGRCDRQGFW